MLISRTLSFPQQGSSWELLIFYLFTSRLISATLFTAGTIGIFTFFSNRVLGKTFTFKKLVLAFLITTAAVIVLIFPKSALFKPDILLPPKIESVVFRYHPSEGLDDSEGIYIIIIPGSSYEDTVEYYDSSSYLKKAGYRKIYDKSSNGWASTRYYSEDSRYPSLGIGKNPDSKAEIDYSIR